MTTTRLTAAHRMALRLAAAAPPGPLADAAADAADTLADMLDPTTRPDCLPVLAALLAGHADDIESALKGAPLDDQPL